MRGQEAEMNAYPEGGAAAIIRYQVGVDSNFSFHARVHPISDG